MNTMSEGADYEEYNHFHRLPEEINVSIFNSIGDLKCLFHCSLVSKHFASVVNRVQNVSIPVIGSAKYDQEYSFRIDNFMMARAVGNADQVQAFFDSLTRQYMKLPAFLDKLTELKCISLDYDYSRKSVSSRIPMQKIKFGRNGTVFESFVALGSLYMLKDTKDEVVEEDDMEHVTGKVARGRDAWWHFVVRYCEWICFAMVLVKRHDSLQKVTNTDSEVNGKLAIGDEQGPPLKFLDLVSLMHPFSSFIVHDGWVPMLRLPVSGYGMIGIALVIVYRPKNPGECAKKLDEIEFWDPEDELPVFREAVREFLKKHQDKLRFRSFGE